MNLNAQLLSYLKNPLRPKCRIYFSSGIPEIMPGFVGFRVTKFLVFYVVLCCYVDCCLSSRRFSFFAMAVSLCFRPLSLIVPSVSFASL